MSTAYQPQFLVATSAEAAVGAELVPLDDVHRVALDFVEGTAISFLQRLLTGRESDCSEYVYAWTESHGPWLRQLPEALVNALASLEHDQIPQLSVQWKEMLEREFEPFEDDLAVTPEIALAELARLARLAKSQGKQVYWKVPGS